MGELLLVILAFSIVLLMALGFAYLLTDPFDWGTKLWKKGVEKESRKNGTSVSFEILKSSMVNFEIERFLQEDFDEIERSGFAQGSINKFFDSSQVFTDDRLALMSNFGKKYGFDLEEISAAEWSQVFSLYSERLRRYLDDDAKEKAATEASKAAVSSEVRNKVARATSLQISADVDRSASVENIVGTKEDIAEDFRSQWNKQYEDITSSNEESS